MNIVIENHVQTYNDYVEDIVLGDGETVISLDTYSDETPTYDKLYMQDLKAVKTYGQLKRFARKWRPVALHMHRAIERRVNRKNFHKFLEFRDNPKVQRKLQYDRRNPRIEWNNIILPFIILQTYFMSERFGVTPNVILFQIINSPHLMKDIPDAENGI